MLGDILHQNLATVQSNQQAKPKTLTSATTLAPVHFMTFVTETVAVATITPPVTGAHMLALIFTDGSPATMVTTGNILNAVVPTPNVPCLMFYDPNQAKYYGMAGNVT
jgi:hypothetical protein